MKRLILTLLIIIISASIYGQELVPDTTKKEFNNVIGLDITGLLGQISNYYPYDYYQYPYYNYLTSLYMITYKRIYKKSAFRFGIGGTVSNNHSTNNDTVGSSSKYNLLNIGLGFEHYGYIAKKWTFYYGADLIGSYSYSYSQYDYSSTIIQKSTTTTYRYGVSPLFGLIFRFNKRLSIATETCYDITYSQSKSENINSKYPYSNTHTKSTGIATQYHAPTTLIIRIQF